MQKLVENYFNRNKLNGSDGESFQSLISQIGYRNQSEFFADNSGAIEVLVNWISKQRCDDWKEALTIPLRDDIRDLLDRGFIELDHDNHYIITSTNIIVVVEDFGGARRLVGSIEIDGDDILLYDEADNEIDDVRDNNVYGHKLK